MFSKTTWLITSLLLVMSPPLLAETKGESDAIRVELENLQQFGRLSVDDVDIASGVLQAEIYERRDYAPTWTDKDQMGALHVCPKKT